MKNTITIRTHASQINHLSWGAKRRHNLTWKQAYHHAVKALGIKQELSTGVVEFAFTKVSDGSIRNARGTRSLEVIPSAYHPKGTSKKSPTTNTVSFYDVDDNQWKSFDITNLIPSLV